MTQDQMAIVYYDGELWRVIAFVKKNDGLWIRISMVPDYECVWIDNQGMVNAPHGFPSSPATL